LFPYPGAAIGI